MAYYIFNYICETFNHKIMYDNSQDSRKYYEMMSPQNIIEELGSGLEFKNWLRTMGITELQENLTAFEDTNDLWLECRTISNVLQEKINTITITHFDEL